MSTRTISLLTLVCMPLFVSALSVVNPRCEDTVNPVGIRRTVPRFSWNFSDVDTQKPAPNGIEFRLGLSPHDLEADWPALVSFRELNAQDLFSISYQGPALRPGTRYFWQVRMLDANGAPATDWSIPARFTIALQTPADWHDAKWIGESAPGGQKWKDLDLSVRFTLVKDAFGVLFRARNSRNYYLWQVNTAFGKPQLRPHICKEGQWRFLPSSPLPPSFQQNHPATLRIVTEGSQIRTYLNGTLLNTLTDDTFSAGTVGFRVSSGESAQIDSFTVKNKAGESLLHSSFESPASSPFAHGTVQNGHLILNTPADLLYAEPLPKNCPRFRKHFLVENKKIRSAFASVCGLGFYELYLNQKKAGDALLAPANTPYRRQILFDTLDVTEWIRPGTNTIGLWLAPGYSDDYSRYGWKWEEQKRALTHLKIIYEDESIQYVTSDASWESTPQSPLTFASLYNGEQYDASLKDPFWCAPAGSRASWSPVVLLAPLSEPLRPNDAPPVRACERNAPVKITQPAPGIWIADMGQNRAGWTQLRARGPKGTRITLRHSELLDKNGKLDPWTNRRASATDVFTLAGTGQIETYTPRFTYHGFRYVEITGFPGTLKPENLTGFAVHADVEKTGTFECSDPTLNKLFNAAKWSMLSNFQSIPTDCPMRDERTPCQMDSQAYEDAALSFFNMARYYEKWLGDIQGGRGNPDWTGDSVTLPWRMFQYTGDIRYLADRFEDMKANVDSVLKKYPDFRCKDGFGDWCPPNAGTWKSYFGDPEIVNSALFCTMIRIVSDAAALLHRPKESAKYRNLFESAKAAFQTHFYNEKSACYGDGSQTTFLLPLAFKLVPDAQIAPLSAQLLRTIREKNKSKLDTGIFGTRYLGDVLCDLGESDLAVTVFTQPEYPGFGYFFQNGATTLWEQWSFRGGMNSHNHAMFSGAANMLFTHLAGIRAAAPGFQKIEIRPSFPEQLSFVRASLQTPRGRCASAWRRENGKRILEIDIPPFTPATLFLPGQPSRPLQSGKQVIRL